MTDLYDILKANRLKNESDPWLCILGEAWMASEEDYKEYTGLVPYTFIGNGTSLLDYLISGNTVQNGAPTPDNPIMPQGTGERTAQLYDKDLPFSKTGKFLKDDGTIDTSNAFNITEYIECDASTDYSLSNVNSLSNTPSVCYYDSSKNYISGKRYGGNTGVSFTTPNTCKYVRFSVRNDKLNEAMLNSGSTALPYEPYGQYKIPILNNSQTTNVYLGEVETTRYIKKLVLDGTTEGWVLYNGNYYSSVTDWYSLQNMPCISTHTARGIVIDNGKVRLKAFASQFTTVASNLEEWKTYLQQQYAAGTPVTVWYVLATPETATINEPLMKIGDYADTLSMEQAGVSIPTVRGTNVIDVGTTLKPSEVYIKYKG